MFMHAGKYQVIWKQAWMPYVAECLSEVLSVKIKQAKLFFDETVRGGSRWERVSPSPEKCLDFGSQMVTFGAFWALSFTVWMHVLQINSSAFD